MTVSGRAFGWVNVLSVAILLVCVAAAIQPPLRERSFSFEYTATVKDVPDGAQELDLWLPVPHGDPYQRVIDLKIESPLKYTIAEDDHGNRILHIVSTEPKPQPVTVVMRGEVVRTEHRQARLLSGGRDGADLPANELSRYLKPDRLVPIDGQIRAWAQEVVDQAHARTDLEKARAIYNHVVSTVKYDKSGKGWGRGDIYYACENRRGNCTDFHAIFIGYCRALGIPARFSIGFPLPAKRGSGAVAGYHCWAEFYAKGIGWVPVDASEAAKDPSKREYFFGTHDENRVEFTKGRDLVLKPQQQASPLNYFVYPYAELDGRAFDGVDHTFAFQDNAEDAHGAASK